MLRAGVWLRHGAGSRFRSCGAARCTAGEVPQIGPSLLSNLKRCFPPLTCARIPGSWSARDGFCARAASSRYITGSEVRPVQCLHTATSRACLRVGRPARLDLLVAAGWNQAPARPAREWSMQAVIGPSCASQPPDGIQWLVRTAGGSPKILGEGSGLGAPAPLAAQATQRSASCSGGHATDPYPPLPPIYTCRATWTALTPFATPTPHRLPAYRCVSTTFTRL